MPLYWKTRDKNRLLRSAMRELAGDAEVSFEGDLKALQLMNLPASSTEETNALKRNTTWPHQDFIVVPLTPLTVEKIIAAMGGTIPRSILHIQIAKAGNLEFGAYDNFAPGMLFLGNATNDSFIDSLKSAGVIEPFRS